MKNDIVDHIFLIIENDYRVTQRTLKSRKKRTEIQVLRTIAGYLIKTYTDYSLTDSASFLNRQHPAILHYFKTINQEIFAKKLTNIENKLIEYLIK